MVNQTLKIKIAYRSEKEEDRSAPEGSDNNLMFMFY